MRDEELIQALIDNFKEVNSFENNIEVLQDTTPNEWKKQLTAASKDLQLLLEQVISDISERLHAAEYMDCSPRVPRK
jgi:hypothetical protein